MFNADSIFDSVEQRNTSSNEGAALRYCSLRNDGTRKVELNQGIIWFLNLCASYKKHMRESLGSQRITFIEPFGSETEGNMLGTESFPALRINEDGYFPMQNDGCNCGVGVCAIIGIMFRDFLPRNEDFLLDDMFSRANMPMHRCESSGKFFNMPVTLMKKVPFHVNTTRGRKEHEKDYLCLLREQWFSLID